MNAANAIAVRSRGPALDLLDEAFSESTLQALTGRGIGPLPWHVWEDALHGPLAEFLSRPGKEFRARLVAHAWSLAGGRGDPPEQLPWLVELLHAGSLIVDDIEDASAERRGMPALHRLHGLPKALNAGNWLYFLPFTLVAQLPSSSTTQLAIHRAMSRSVLQCHYGQALDLSARMSRLERTEVPSVVAATTRLKTASLTELATTLGAVAAGADAFRERLLARFGRDLGIGLQRLDDFGSITSDSRCHKGHEDLVGSRPTWPWAWLADNVDASTYAALQSMARRVEQRDVHPELLIRQMRPHLAGGSGDWVRGELWGVVESLEATFAGSPVLERIRGDVERLERSYE